MSDTKSVTTSFPVFSILGMIFILAKVFEFGPPADWSWFWVLSPFWIPLGAVLAFLFVGMIFLAVGTAFSGIKTVGPRRRR